MPLYYENLDPRTRQLMLDEVEIDNSKGTLYFSPRLTENGKTGYLDLLKQAIKNYTDAWLANELNSHAYLNAFEQRKKQSGRYSTVRVPVNAAETLAEGEFNRFYVRGLCRRAIEEGIDEVEIYRGKEVLQPRPESVAMIGKHIAARELLDDLRKSQGVEPALGLPPGPNSGLTVRLPV